MRARDLFLFDVTNFIGPVCYRRGAIHVFKVEKKATVHFPPARLKTISTQWTQIPCVTVHVIEYIVAFLYYKYYDSKNLIMEANTTANLKMEHISKRGT